MNPTRFAATSLLILGSVFSLARADSPPQQLPAVHDAMTPFLDSKEIAGVVTVVVAPDGIRHLDAQGFADVDQKKPMTADAVFWIASMTKPITATAVLMLQDEGRL